MLNLCLYFLTAFIWGSTWLAIQYQLGSVPPLWSVVYRFSLAAILLLSFCILTKRSLRFNYQQHFYLFLQGLLFFSTNYVLCYIASKYFISGIIAVIFASIILINIANARIFFKTPILPQNLFGACLGLLGLTCIIWSQIHSVSQINNGAYALQGLAITLLATLVASLGNIVSTYNIKQGIPILQSNAWGMTYGTLTLLITALLLHIRPSISFEWHYISSLLYLSFFGTIIAFSAYLCLLERIGPEKAAYTFVLLPIIAMLLSTFFEGFQWKINTFIGTGLVLLGNILVLNKKHFIIKLIRTIKVSIPYNWLEQE